LALIDLLDHIRIGFSPMFFPQVPAPFYSSSSCHETNCGFIYPHFISVVMGLFVSI